MPVSPRLGFPAPAAMGVPNLASESTQKGKAIPPHAELPTGISWHVPIQDDDQLLGMRCGHCKGWGAAINFFRRDLWIAGVWGWAPHQGCWGPGQRGPNFKQYRLEEPEFLPSGRCQCYSSCLVPVL